MAVDAHGCHAQNAPWRDGDLASCAAARNRSPASGGRSRRGEMPVPLPQAGATVIVNLRS